MLFIAQQMKITVLNLQRSGIRQEKKQLKYGTGEQNKWTILAKKMR